MYASEMIQIWQSEAGTRGAPGAAISFGCPSGTDAAEMRKPTA
jgi:hypothetical protein